MTGTRVPWLHGQPGEHAAGLTTRGSHAFTAVELETWRPPIFREDRRSRPVARAEGHLLLAHTTHIYCTCQHATMLTPSTLMPWSPSLLRRRPPRACATSRRVLAGRRQARCEQCSQRMGRPCAQYRRRAYPRAPQSSTARRSRFAVARRSRAIELALSLRVSVLQLAPIPSPRIRFHALMIRRGGSYVRRRGRT